MALKLYNTLTRKKEIFKPIKKNTVSFYHCGPTVYWTQHLGNMRSMFCADSVVRVLKYLDYQIKHV
ncbi:MAG: cysteine--tRNA ligase, partial [Candidatus Portnoybacteria bacterium]|nr:cysteine--tRNA ligase [Candidatus Portnoybacteria bacterium]